MRKRGHYGLGLDESRRRTGETVICALSMTRPMFPYNSYSTFRRCAPNETSIHVKLLSRKIDNDSSLGVRHDQGRLDSCAQAQNLVLLKASHHGRKKKQ